MDTAVESALRLQIIAWVHEQAERNGGFLHRQELLGFRIDDRDLPLIDFSRGIRNPAGFASTLAIVQSAHGPYDALVRRDRVREAISTLEDALTLVPGSRSILSNMELLGSRT